MHFLTALKSSVRCCRNFRFITTYIQGQYVANNVREYFYFIDHQGQLFLDDSKMKNFTSCFKEKDFLRFFFKRLRLDKELKYKDFPYISPCGKEMNYVKCDDLPIVFTKVLTLEDKTVLSYNNADEKLTYPFIPSSVFMDSVSGRVYHLGPENAGGIGLMKSSIAIEWTKYFVYDDTNSKETDPPTHFIWDGIKYTLTNEVGRRLREGSEYHHNHQNA